MEETNEVNNEVKKVSTQTTVSFRKDVKTRFEEQKAQGKFTDKTFNAFVQRATELLLGVNNAETKKAE
jgi:hypothetical protein